jgi:hypothetical protein
VANDRTRLLTYSSDITAAFLDICLSQSEVEPGGARDQSGSMSLQERMDLWEKNEDMERPSVEEGLESLEILEEEEDIYGDAEVWVAAYREFAPNTEAYSWLLTQLQRDMNSAPTEPTAIQLIRDQVLSSLPSPHRISRSISSESCSVLFEVDWDILEFYDSQGYSKAPSEVLHAIITLTGSSCDAQASNCAQFFKQTWPVTGDLMLQLIRDLLKLPPGHTHSCKIKVQIRHYFVIEISNTSKGRLPDGTELTGCIMESKIMVQADGSAASISEAGEQLAWLGAALRSSPLQKGLTYCTPSIRSISQRREMPQASLLQSNVVCEIGFNVEPLSQPSDIANGHCWHGIFKNPIIVNGFPILPKYEKNTGLEIPLNIMAGLARAQCVDRFNDKVYIKGFSTMLVPMKQYKDAVYWHLIYNEDGCRISYLDDIRHQDNEAGSLDLTNCRQVLGWCSEAKFYAGETVQIGLTG